MTQKGYLEDDYVKKKVRNNVSRIYGSNVFNCREEKHIMTITEKLYEAVKDLPEPMISEIFDFAEFLRQRKLPKGGASRKPITA